MPTEPDELACYSVVAKKGRGKKQQFSESSRLLSVLYSEGLRQQDLDADCRHYLESSSESVKAKVSAQLVPACKFTAGYATSILYASASCVCFCRLYLIFWT